jgi:hypothetical protein
MISMIRGSFPTPVPFRRNLLLTTQSRSSSIDFDGRRVPNNGDVSVTIIISSVRCCCCCQTFCWASGHQVDSIGGLHQEG